MTDLLVRVALGGLAGWRLAAMVSYEDGPFDIFVRLRAAIGLRPMAEITGFLPRLVSCVWCLSVWTAGLMVGLSFVAAIIPVLFAAAAVAVLVERAARP